VAYIVVAEMPGAVIAVDEELVGRLEMSIADVTNVINVSPKLVARASRDDITEYLDSKRLSVVLVTGSAPWPRQKSRNFWNVGIT
jgi:hypothetical protein